MGEGSFWLDDLQWSSIKGCLPGRKPRGPQRGDDRRVISGIIPGLQSGMRWRDARKSVAPRQRFTTVGAVARGKARGAFSRAADRARRQSRGAFAQAPAAGQKTAGR